MRFQLLLLLLLSAFLPVAARAFRGTRGLTHASGATSVCRLALLHVAFSSSYSSIGTGIRLLQLQLSFLGLFQLLCSVFLFSVAVRPLAFTYSVLRFDWLAALFTAPRCATRFKNRLVSKSTFRECHKSALPASSARAATFSLSTSAHVLSILT